MALENSVARHYTQGSLEQAILGALAASGKDPAGRPASLARRVGLEDRVSYLHGSALDLPFAAGSFDGAYMPHVGMNIEDKARLFAELQRVLRPGGFFGIYDVMREEGEGGLSFPVPWATIPGS